MEVGGLVSRYSLYPSPISCSQQGPPTLDKGSMYFLENMELRASGAT